MPTVLDNFWHWTLDIATGKTIWWYGWGLLILLIVFLWLSKKVRKDLVPILSDDEGNVRITPHALQELVSNKLEKVMVENLCFSNFGGVDLIIKGFKDS